MSKAHRRLEPHATAGIAVVVAMGLAVPALQSGVNADPPKGKPPLRFGNPICITGKLRPTGRVVLLPNKTVAKRILVAQVGCGVSRFIPVGDPCRCRYMPPPK